MKKVGDVLTPFTDPIVPPPTGPASGNVVGTGADPLVKDSPPAASFEGGPLVDRLTPKNGEAVPSNFRDEVYSKTSGFSRIPNT